MTVTPQRDPSGGSQTTRVTVVLPDAREHIWTSNGSGLTSWDVGQVVVFRNCRWRVVGRQAELADAVTLTLGPLE